MTSNTILTSLVRNAFGNDFPAESAALCYESDSITPDDEGKTRANPGEVYFVHRLGEDSGSSIIYGNRHKDVYGQTNQHIAALYKHSWLPLERVEAAQGLAVGDLIVVHEVHSGGMHASTLVGLILELGEPNLTLPGYTVARLAFVKNNLSTDHPSLAVTDERGDYYLRNASHPVSDTSHQLVWRAVTVPQPEPEGETPPTTLCQDPAHEGVVAQLQSKDDTIENLRRSLANVRSEQQADAEVINSILLGEADRRNWCSEFDQVIDMINERVTVALEGRTRDYDVTFRVSGQTSVTVDDGTISTYVDIEWEFTVEWRVSEVRGNPGEVDFTEYVNFAELADQVDPFDVEMHLEGEVQDYSAAWDTIRSETGSWQVAIEEEQYEAV